jgi:hypothetical protein
LLTAIHAAGGLAARAWLLLRSKRAAWLPQRFAHQEGEMSRRAVETLPASATDLRALVAESAYFKAERRGFAPGHELEDWLAAERELVVREPQPTKPTRAAPAAAPTAKKRAVARKSNGGISVKRAATLEKVD